MKFPIVLPIFKGGSRSLTAQSYDPVVILPKSMDWFLEKCRFGEEMLIFQNK